MKYLHRHWRSLALRCAGVACFLIAWEIAGRYAGVAILAPPTSIAPMLVGAAGDTKLLTTIADSLKHLFIGYALACVVGTIAGVAMGRIRWLEVIFYPWLSMLIVTSVASLIPLLILWLGSGLQFRIVVVFVSSVFYITSLMYEGARNVDRKWLDVARAFSASPLQRFRKVILYAMVPYAFTAARVGLGQALRGMVVAELFVLVGIGGLLFYSGQEVSTAGNFALLFILMAIALAANGLLGMAEKILAPWQGEARQT